MNPAKKQPIGRRVEVFYNKQQGWVPGTVICYNNNAKKHEILFDDYDEDTILISLVGSKKDKWKYLERDDERYIPPVQNRTGKWSNTWPLQRDLILDGVKKYNLPEKIDEDSDIVENPQNTTESEKNNEVILPVSQDELLSSTTLINDPNLRGEETTLTPKPKRLKAKTKKIYPKTKQKSNYITEPSKSIYPPKTHRQTNKPWLKNFEMKNPPVRNLLNVPQSSISNGKECKNLKGNYTESSETTSNSYNIH